MLVSTISTTRGHQTGLAFATAFTWATPGWRGCCSDELIQLMESVKIGLLHLRALEASPTVTFYAFQQSFAVFGLR